MCQTLGAVGFMLIGLGNKICSLYADFCSLYDCHNIDILKLHDCIDTLIIDISMIVDRLLSNFII